MDLARSYHAALREGFTSTTSPLAASNDLKEFEADPAGYLEALNAQGGHWQLPDGRTLPRVPFAHLWLIAGETFIGRVSIRYELNDWLRQTGGHVGYAIRPSFRQRGFGHRALALALVRLQERQVYRALLTCADSNFASARIIERAGGVLAETGPHPERPGEMIRRYWIDLA